jgi:tetratricopeptide (TPR) repeat protein
MVVLAAGCHAPPRPESETPFESGNRALAAGEHVTATAQFTLAIENAKDYFYTRAYLRRGESHLLAANKESDSKLKADHLGLARRDFDAVLSQNDLLSEEEAEALEKRGVILAQQADWARAEESFTRILGLKLPQGASDYHVTAYRQLGRILLQRALAARKEGPSAEEELEMQENFRKAQERFSIGLQINKEDEGCNLGKGICLHFRGQNNEAITYLEKSTSLSGAKNSPNPKGHFYLARAYEMQMGLHIKALEHYHQAVSEDVAHEFTPLYAQLVAELNRNVFFGNPEFDWFFRSMLSYRGNDPIHSPSYWEGVEALAVQRWIGDSLEKGGDPQKEASREPVQTGIFARALARARIRKVEDAVKDALLLNKGQSFSERLEQIFPVESVTSQLPQDVYGKALTLLKAKRHEELEQFFESEAFRAFAASATKNEKEERDEKNAKPEKNEKEDYYRRTILLEGRNIVEMWEDELKRSPTLTTDVKIERDKKLGRARDIFQSYLRERRDDNEIRMQLGRVQELMDSFATAYLTYELLTKESKHYPAAFHSILKLHRERLLTGKDLEAAWKLLLDYDGDDKSIKEYVQRTKGQLEADASLYCLSCGRKGTEGDTLCVECGHPIGLAALPVLPGRGPVDSEK